MSRKSSHRSYAAWFFGPGFDAAGHTNAMRFPTEPEATAYAAALFQRWTMPTGFEVRPSTDAPNYRWNVDTRACESIDTRSEV